MVIAPIGGRPPRRAAPEVAGDDRGDRRGGPGRVGPAAVHGGAGRLDLRQRADQHRRCGRRSGRPARRRPRGLVDRGQRHGAAVGPRAGRRCAAGPGDPPAPDAHPGRSGRGRRRRRLRGGRVGGRPDRGLVGRSELHPRRGSDRRRGPLLLASAHHADREPRARARHAAVDHDAVALGRCVAGWPARRGGWDDRDVRRRRADLSVQHLLPAAVEVRGPPGGAPQSPTTRDGGVPRRHAGAGRARPARRDDGVSAGRRRGRRRDRRPAGRVPAQRRGAAGRAVRRTGGGGDPARSRRCAGRAAGARPWGVTDAHAARR